MKRALLSLTLVSVLVLGVCAASASAHDYPRNCGDQSSGVYAGWSNLKSFNTKCPEARDTASHYYNSRDKHFNGWKCHSKQLGSELFKANCVRNRSRHQHIKFLFGS